MLKRKHKKCCGFTKISGKASLTPLQTGGPKGFVTFERVSSKRGQVRVKAEVTNLKANQKFGFHVHEFGDCSDKALKVGGHLSFNHHKHHKHKKPSQHGGPLSPNKNLGDLGNLSSDSKGKASYDQVLKGRLKMFLGRSVIIQNKKDNVKTQTTGNSGAKIACGIIGASLSESQ